MKMIVFPRKFIAISALFLAGFHAAGAAVLSSPGITEPILDVTVSTPVSGIIGQRLVKEGDFVKGGQAVIELDKKLEELEANRRKLVMELTEIELARVTKLLERNAISISREEMDKKQSEYNVAAVEHELSKEILRRRHIFSPLDGYVTDLFLEAGEACQAQQAVARVVDTRRCYFISNVEARSGHHLKAGQQVDLDIEAGAAMVRIQGAISFVSPVVDPASGLLKVKVIFDNQEGKIRPGVAGTMFFQEASHVN